MKVKTKIAGHFNVLGVVFLIVASFFLFEAPLLAQEQGDSMSSEKGLSERNDERTNPQSEGRAPAQADALQATLKENVLDESGVSDMDAEKAMEKELRETMIKEAKAYYPMTHSFSLEAKDDVVVIELAYDQPSEKDILVFRQNLVKDTLRAQIILSSPLLQKVSESKIEGDHQFIELITLTPNKVLSSKLGNDSQLFFVDQIQFQLLKPVRWKVTQIPGMLRIEFTPYLADAEEEVKTEEDIVFQPPPPESTDQILGQSYAQDRQRERELVSDGEPTLLERLESNGASQLLGSEKTDYSRGLSEEAVRHEMKTKYPRFGTFEYWKKSLSGVISNTARFSKRERNQSFFPADTPGMALVFDRKGPAHVRLGYNVQREFPFFYGDLYRSSRLAPMDGFMRHDIQGGIVFVTQSPWTYSIQNRYSIGTSENLSQPEKFGDRLSTYQYDAAQGIRYSLKRGYLQFGSGVKWQTEERGLNEDVTGFLSESWVHRWSKKIETTLEHNYSNVFLHDPKPIRDRNVHKMYFGVKYSPNKNVSLTPGMGLSYYDRESFIGVRTALEYKHRFNPRDRLTVTYSSDLSSVQTVNFGSESLTGTRTTFNSGSGLIRYQNLAAVFQHQMTKRMNLTLGANYRNEKQANVKHSDKFDQYRISAALSRQISKQWALELKYTFIYLDAYKLISDGSGGFTKNDSGNTNHAADFRLIRYFGETGR